MFWITGPRNEYQSKDYDYDHAQEDTQSHTSEVDLTMSHVRQSRNTEPLNWSRDNIVIQEQNDLSKSRASRRKQNLTFDLGGGNELTSFQADTYGRALSEV